MIETKSLSDLVGKDPNFTGCARLFSAQAIYHFKNGLFHSEEGPAVVGLRGGKAWWLFDQEFNSEEAWQVEVLKLKMRRIVNS